MKDKVEIYSDVFPTCLGIVNELEGVKQLSPKFGENVMVHPLCYNKLTIPK